MALIYLLEIKVGFIFINFNFASSAPQHLTRIYTYLKLKYFLESEEETNFLVEVDR